MGIFDAAPGQAPIVPLLVVTFYTAPIPLASALARPGGIVERTLVPLLSFAAQGNEQQSVVTRLATLAAFYVFVAYAFTAGLSVSGQAAGTRPGGYKNTQPRTTKNNLTGFTHRLTALHQNLMEIFPAFALCAAVTLALPNSELQEKSLNYLTLHVFLKTVIYVPAYAANLDTLRSLSHFLGIASMLGMLVGVARG